MRLLLVEDEALQREMLAGHLQARGYVVYSVGSAEEALEEVQAHRVDIVLADFRLPGRSGLDLVEQLRNVNPEVAVVMMTAYATVDVAVRAMKTGAVDFVTKPLELDTLDAVLARVVDSRQLVAENERLRRRLAQLETGRTFLGVSFEFRKVLDLAARVAASDSTVLITGETGCGKEMLADLIQSQGRRRQAAFVKVNCGAIPHELFESELFGHRRGAFTGADRDRPGHITEADGGTLLLDEVAELPPAAQVKMLRVLQDGQYFPVGSDRPRSADVRLIACTNRNLEAMVSDGGFREDLFFRLSVVPIHIPPLRRRREDIGPLLDHFLADSAARLNAGPRQLSSSARDALIKYDWPGNARQLRNVMERLVLLSRSPVIDLADLPPEITAPSAGHPSPVPDGPVDLEALISELEQSHLRRALETCKGNQTRAAEVLGLSERVLRYKLKKHGIFRGPHQ